MSLLKDAQKGITAEQIEAAAAAEGVAAEVIRQGVADGTIVVPCNPAHKGLKPMAIGKGLRTKVSASIGLDSKESTVAYELEKLQTALAAGTHAIMDLSVTGDMDGARRAILSASPVPVGTLPLYQTIAEAGRKYGSALKMTPEQMLEVIERQAADGVDFMALHCATTFETIERAKNEGRIDPLVSYGGSHIIGWMVHHKRENPLYENYDRILEIAKKYSVTLSLADGMRPGCLADSLDGAQVQELIMLGELVDRARQAGVQIMIKGPGHMPLNHIKNTMTLQKSLCQGAPYFVFGPLLTDLAVGYDHINAAIGGAISSWYGAEFLCYVTPAEHIGNPDVVQVRQGVIAARIAAQAGDLAKGLPEAVRWDLDMSNARRDLKWTEQIKLAIDPEHAEYIRKTRNEGEISTCAMCGKFCAMKIIAEHMHIEKHSC
ncbi:phosphomethylpyrimidine synthase [Desulfotomaculum arcticum]|uniref:Phosphomethylpyrimidine synthase n=1 Tax=Desulfotruncus arcticus DSM 17038 TaxID=1121424 RepID=A0A1I2TM71_9FIRM|nr:phosphomethylpyrimidine synthase ThiC [Desulfotruncus arcticus]SFG63546.1 phosphomethylpyrimidine synthase [Desulfotomaculum arcticum] [Desulfotruncus arcticus DSM 17038]